MKDVNVRVLKACLAIVLAMSSGICFTCFCILFVVNYLKLDSIEMLATIE